MPDAPAPAHTVQSKKNSDSLIKRFWHKLVGSSDTTPEKDKQKDTAKKLPIGWVVVYIGLIIWGIFYVVNYLPQISGWTQAGEYEQSIEDGSK